MLGLINIYSEHESKTTLTRITIAIVTKAVIVPAT